MLIIRVMGGLGNQLFQYAFYELLLQKGKEVCLDISHYSEEEGKGDKRSLDLLLFDGISFRFCTDREKYRYLDEKNTFFAKVRRKFFYVYRHVIEEKSQYMPELFELSEGYLEGYWNSERYSGQIERLLRQKLCFPAPVEEKTRALAEKLQERNSVSIHIRRGDYLTPRNAEIFGNICTDEYYGKAVEIMRRKIENPVFYIFCEDSDYIREHIKREEAVIVDWNKGRSSIYDMYLMSLCRGSICANSTFSIWAAKLNQRQDCIRIRPEKLDHLVVQDAGEIDELKKNQWILVDSLGKEV